MRIPFLLTATALFASSAWAQDDESPYYLQFNVGGVVSEDADDGTEFDPGFTTGLTLGRSFELEDRWNFEAEFETYYQYFKLDEAVAPGADDDCKALAFMLNGNLDWEFTPQYSVYGGVGFGWAEEIDYGALDDDGPAFQAKLGLSYNLGGTYDSRLGYRYFRREAGDSEDVDIAQHVLELGFRWSL